jgi:hypothetical protein
MTPSVVLIARPAIDFDTFLTISHRLLGYSVAAKVDQSRLEHSDTERFITCLAALNDPNAAVGLPPNLLNFAAFSILVVADERDLLDIVEAAGSIPVRLAETVQRGVMMAVLHGTLAQWRDAVKSGCDPAAEHNVRACFCQIMGLFEKMNLGHLWKDSLVKPLQDNTFFLEDKRR